MVGRDPYLLYTITVGIRAVRCEDLVAEERIFTFTRHGALDEKIEVNDDHLKTGPAVRKKYAPAVD